MGKDNCMYIQKNPMADNISILIEEKEATKQVIMRAFYIHDCQKITIIFVF